jgi:Circularly permutated YpsA SLOG family
MEGLKIISGGQTGVDQAALRAAQKLGLGCGGWCPPGRWSEAGAIPSEFPLEETPAERSPEAPEIPRSLRTEWNVRDADATLVLEPQAGQGTDAGTGWTRRCALKYGRPLLVCNLEDPQADKKIAAWLSGLSTRTLNVAGPSESAAPGIGAKAYALLLKVFGR